MSLDACPGLEFNYACNVGKKIYASHYGTDIIIEDVSFL